MKIVYSGAEVGSNRTLLEKSNVTLMGLNYWGLRKRGLPKTKTWLISEHFDSNTKVCIDYAFGTDGSNGIFVNLGEVF